MIMQIPEATGIKTIKTFIDDFLGVKTSQYRRWNQYYEGNHDILMRTKEEGQANHKLVFQFPKLIINTAHNYLMGKPMTYANNISLDDEEYADTEEFVKRLHKLFVKIDEPFHTSELIKNTSICGDGYEYVYLSKATKDVKLTEFPASECIPVYSPATKELEMLIRFYEIAEVLPNDKTDKYYSVEVYDNTKIEYFIMKDGKLYLDTEKPAFEHGMGEIPVVHYRNTKIATSEYGMSDLKDVDTLIDEYEAKASDLSNTLDYNGNPIMKLINCVMDDDQYKDMLNKRVMQIPEGGEASYLTWDQQIGAITKQLETLQDAILTFSSTPKLYKDNDEGNPMSGISIKMKFSGADLKANDKERNYRQGIRKRLRLIANIWNQMENSTFNADDVDIIFNRSIPQNLQEIADIVVALKGTVSEETLLGLLPFVADVQTELQRVANQTKNADTQATTNTSTTEQTNDNLNVNTDNTGTDNKNSNNQV